jgi:hypothetical protein
MPGIIAVRGDVLRHINLLQNVDVVIEHGEGVSDTRRSIDDRQC